MKKCPISKKCGGCSLIAEEYEQQLVRKHDEIQKLFGRIRVEDVIGMKDPYHYRHKVYATFYKDRKNQIHAGIYQENSHRLLDSSMCLIQHVKANQILKTICVICEKLKIEPYDEDRQTGVLRHAYIRVSHHTQKVMAVLVIGSKSLPSSKTFVSLLRQEHPEIETVILNYNRLHTSMILGRRSDVLYGKGYITDRIGGLEFRISPQSFYQINPVQTEVIYNTAIDMADLKENDLVLDACCGIGTISLMAAKKCGNVIGVEINPAAISDAKINQKINGIENVSFHTDDAEKFILAMKENPDTVFLDPPRSGLSAAFLNTLAKKNPKTIVYVSCNPETQIRDCRILHRYGYRIRRAVPVDNFPFTNHVETIVLMTHNRR